MIRKFLCAIGIHKWERIVRQDTSQGTRDALIVFYFLIKTVGEALSNQWKCKYCGKEK